jgi:hypothetical protein
MKFKKQSGSRKRKLFSSRLTKLFLICVLLLIYKFLIQGEPEMDLSAFTGKSGEVPKIDLFKKGNLAKGNLEKKLDEANAIPEDRYQSGNWQSGYKTPLDNQKYLGTLGGKPVSSYDPNGFFKELGLPDDLKAPGRTDKEMYKAFKLVDYKPDPQYFPGPKWLATPVQNGLVALGRTSPDIATKLDSLATKTVIKKLEKADTIDPNPYGKIEDIKQGDKLAISPSERYLGIISKGNTQFAWDSGVHTGSPKPTHENEKFGTYDIALKIGFTEEQATNISVEDFAVDENKTHYHDPKDPEKTRITHSGTGGDNGDLGWHYNRSKDGAEDSRITAAKTHLERAITLAKEGSYQSAEKELGIGLHSLQDMFSHGQITPVNHITVGEFPDFVKWNPVGMYETAMATEAYLKKFVNSLELKRDKVQDGSQLKTVPLIDHFNFIPGVAPEKSPAIGKIVTGSATIFEQLELAKQLNNYPVELLNLLNNKNVRIFLGKEGAKLTELGFGADLDKDKKITPGKWTDVNKDGRKQNFEVEDKLADGRSWNDQKAGYNHNNKVVFISGSLLADSKDLDAKLRHEIEHAVDLNLADDPKLKNKWQSYINKLYESGRRSGEIAFDQLEAHEFFAEKPVDEK